MSFGFGKTAVYPALCQVVRFLWILLALVFGYDTCNTIDKYVSVTIINSRVFAVIVFYSCRYSSAIQFRIDVFVNLGYDNTYTLCMKGNNI